MNVMLAAGCLFLALSAKGHPEYLYPVVSYKTHEGERLLVLYQKSIYHTELWQWDPVTKLAEKLLPSLYNPAGITLLPDHSGFSFIDEGRIRIKKFTKRSAVTLDIGMPLHALGVVHWYTATTGYCSAKFGTHYGIYQVHTNGDVERLRASVQGDCLYPAKVGDALFYIERLLNDDESSYSYHVACADYPAAPLSFDQHDCRTGMQELDEMALGTQRHVMVGFGKNPLILLTMMSNTQGFVIEHPHQIQQGQLTIPFNCYAIHKEHDGWHKNLLLSFSLPTALVVHTDDIQLDSVCLYESIVPLMPRYHEGTLYFVSCDASAKNQSLTLYTYRCDTQNIIPVIQSKTIVFVPCISGSSLFYGIDMPDISEDQEGNNLIHFPYININK